MPKSATIFDDEQTGLKDQLVFKFSHVVADNTPKGLAAKKFAELVHEKSDGRISIQIFSNGSLYSDIEEINALKENQVQFIAPSTSKLGMLSLNGWHLICPLPFLTTMLSKKGYMVRLDRDCSAHCKRRTKGNGLLDKWL